MTFNRGKTRTYGASVSTYIYQVGGRKFECSLTLELKNGKLYPEMSPLVHPVDIPSNAVNILCALKIKVMPDMTEVCKTISDHIGVQCSVTRRGVPCTFRVRRGGKGGD